MKTNGGELLTSSVQTVCGNLSLPMRAGAGRLQIPSSNLMPAHLFPSPTKSKKGKGKERYLGWSCGWGDGDEWSTSTPAESVAGMGPRHWNPLEHWESGKWLQVYSKGRAWASASCGKKGRGRCEAQRVGDKPDFMGLWIRVWFKKQRGICTLILFPSCKLAISLHL